MSQALLIIGIVSGLIWATVTLGVLLAGLVEFEGSVNERERRSGSRLVVRAPLWPIDLINLASKAIAFHRAEQQEEQV